MHSGKHNPLREDAHRLVMRAFCRLGRRNAALEQYRRCQQIVRRELDAEPMEETSELYQAILDGRFEVGPALEIPAAGKVVLEAALSQGQNPLDPIVRGPLMGREAEMASLRDRYMGAKAEHGGLVLVWGEAGVGKTRLMEELAGQLRWQGVRVLWGRCYEFERLVPFQPVGEALQTVLSTIVASDLANICVQKDARRFSVDAPPRATYLKCLATDSGYFFVELRLPSPDFILITLLPRALI